MRNLLLILCIHLTASIALAGSVYVDDNAAGDPAPGDPAVSDPAEDGSAAHPFDAVQEAIDFITDPNIYNEVIILPSTYTGDGNRDIDFMGKPITVRGTDPNDPCAVAATIIDCQGTEANPHRGFYFHSGETDSSVLKGLTITNGYGPVIVVSVIDSAPRSYGGGIFCDMASPKLQNITIADSISDAGGAVFAISSHMQLTSCILSGNRAIFSGGAGYFYYGDVFMDKCIISLNYSQNAAGGIGSTESDLVLKCCTVTKNETNRVGGGIYVRGSITLEKTLICENVSTRGGAGIYLDMCTQNVIIHKSIIAGNHSKLSGGGMYVNNSEPVISNCTIVGNRADKGGGGIFCDENANVTISNSIVRDNSASTSNQVGFPALDFFVEEPGYMTASYNNIQGGQEAMEGWSMIAWQAGNIDIAPLFADAGSWDGDIWTDGDYHLKSYAGRWKPALDDWVMDDVHSPCIDAGDPLNDFASEPAYNGQRINMGAFGGTEFASKTPNCPNPPQGDLDGDCKVTLTDFAIMAANWR